MENPDEAKGSGGLLYGAGAYVLWGLMPLYIWSMDRVPSLEILAHRVVWCSVVLVFLLTGLSRWGAFGRVLRNPRTLGLLGLSSLLIATNWYCYIFGANNGQTIQTSLGYFINPLFSVLLGMIFFRERLRPVQWVALFLATVGVLILVVVTGELPWIALVLAVGFGLYGLVRKVTPVDAVTGLAVETLLLVPVAGAFLLYWTATGTGSFGQMGWDIDALLLAAGVVTAVPLLCFGQAARRLPLTTIGLLQYIAPTLQFLLAVLIRGEALLPAKVVSFGFIWTALVVFSVESLLVARRRHVLEKRLAEEAQAPVGVS